jgi:hypothetical protein
MRRDARGRGCRLDVLGQSTDRAAPHAYRPGDGRRAGTKAVSERSPYMRTER